MRLLWAKTFPLTYTFRSCIWYSTSRYNFLLLYLLRGLSRASSSEARLRASDTKLTTADTGCATYRVIPRTRVILFVNTYDNGIPKDTVNSHFCYHLSLSAKKKLTENYVIFVTYSLIIFIFKGTLHFRFFLDKVFFCSYLQHF